MARVFAILFCFALAAPLQAAPADVVNVDVSRNPDGSYRIAVTIASDETGWDKYADRWDVLDSTGTVLGTRVLHHPHVTEQPFTRSLSALRLPPGLTEIRVRAHDSVEGYGGAEMIVPLP